MIGDPESGQSQSDATGANGDWRSRVIVGRELGATLLPPWAQRSYQILHHQVADDAYPCFFGVQAERRGEMFYAFLCRGEEAVLSETLGKFAELTQLPRYDKNNIAVFFEPDPQPLSHREYHDRFWLTLQRLHDVDTHFSATHQVAPGDPEWEFCYQGVEMFVVCACPSFGKRRSRNLGPGMVLLFQPRSVFIDRITNKVIGRRAREQVRRRLEVWDEIGAHPDLGFYGDPGNLEWKQYFLPDDSRPNTGICPFTSRRSRPYAQGPLEQQRAGPDLGALLRQHARQVGDDAAAHFFAEGEAVAHTLGCAEHEWRASAGASMTAVGERHPSIIQVASSPGEHSADRTVDTAEDGSFPLTAAQEALWFLWCMDPDSPAYNTSMAIEIKGSLEVAVLRSALNVLVERHAILRSAFMNICGVARQCVANDGTHVIDWVEHDLHSGVQLMASAQQLLKDRGNHSFDLGGDGLLRCTLVHFSANRHVLQVCTHQIVLDAWSFNLLRRELMECYTALLERRLPCLPPLRIQFGNFARQTREHQDLPAQERQLRYWRERLGDPSHLLDLPLDHPRGPYRATAAERLSHVVTPSLHEAVGQLAAALDTRPFVVMLSAFALLLQRYSGQGDVRMAVPLLRRDPALDGTLIGHFMNTTVLRLSVSSAERFSSLIDQTQRQLSEAHAQGGLPFSRLVDFLQVQRSLAVTPLSQVMFCQLPTFAPELHGSLHVSLFDDGVGRACYDLAMNVGVDRDRSILCLDYSSSLFEPYTAQRLLAHYLELLDQVTRPAVAANVMAGLSLSRIGDLAAAAA